MLTFLYLDLPAPVPVLLRGMILLVLIQKGRGGGLSGAFGGGGGGNTAFGAKTGDVLTWATSIVFALFVILAVVLNLVCDKWARPRSRLATNAASPGRHAGFALGPLSSPLH